MMRKGKQIAAKWLIAVMMTGCLGGCGEAEPVPELLDAVAQAYCYRPVEKMELSKKRFYLGRVVAKEKYYYFDKPTAVKEILCEPGDEVKAGDVLAYIDIESTEKTLTEKQEELALYLQKREYERQLEDLELDSQKGFLDAAYAREDLKEYDKLCKQFSELASEKEYNEELFDYMTGKYEEEIADLQRKIEEGRILAKKDGVVLYCKDVTMQTFVPGYETILTVADPTEPLILMDAPQDRSGLGEYPLRYAHIGEDIIPVEEIVPSESVRYYASTRGEENLPFYLKPSEDYRLQIGDTLLVEMRDRSEEPVLCVGYDSLYKEEENFFVYVQTPDGKQERRTIETAPGDGRYQKVISGLEEGELVAYMADSPAPGSFREYEVTTADYTLTEQGGLAGYMPKNEQVYTAKTNGILRKLHVNLYDWVEKGDLLYELEGDGQKEELARLEAEVTKLELEYVQSSKELQDNRKKQQKNLNEQQENLLSFKAFMDYRDLDEFEASLRAQKNAISAVDVQADLRKAEYEYNHRRLERELSQLKKSCAEDGITYVYAKESGTVTYLFRKEGEYIDAAMDNLILRMEDADFERLYVLYTAPTETHMAVGSNIRFIEGEDTVSGTCIGRSPVYQDAFVEKEDRVERTSIRNEGQRGTLYVVEPDGEIPLMHFMRTQVESSYLELKNHIVIPGNLLHIETILMQEYGYVWKLVNGTPVKQYIVRGRDFRIGSDNEVLVLSGLYPGDILCEKEG